MIEEGYYYCKPPWYAEDQKKDHRIWEIGRIDDHGWVRCDGAYEPMWEGWVILDKVPDYAPVLCRSFCGNLASFRCSNPKCLGPVCKKCETNGLCEECEDLRTHGGL